MRNGLPHQELDAFVNKTIPRRIIQIWGGGLDLPLLARAAAANVRLLNPEFE